MNIQTNRQMEEEPEKYTRYYDLQRFFVLFEQNIKSKYNAMLNSGRELGILAQ